MKVAVALLGLLGTTAALAETPERQLARVTEGRLAGAQVDCIRPEFAVLPEIVDGQAIIYRATGILYVVRPAGECADLRSGAQLRTSSINGQLCRGEQFRVTSQPGASGFRICVFGGFTPYRKAR